MIKHARNCLFVILLAGCAAFDTSPEAQIKTGADSLKATTTLATVALRNDAITVNQAKSFRVMIGASSTTLDDANKTLLECRKKTGSTAETKPDPCRLAVQDVIKISLDNIANVKRTLDAKQ